MKDTVKKWMADDFLRIGRNECWLEDMAKEGLHLERMGKFCAVFRRGTPADVRYRIDVSAAPPESSQISLYQEAGWYYVARSGHFSIYRSPAERGAPELHTDPAQQGYSLEETQRLLRRTAILVGVLFLLFIALMIPIFLGRTPWLSLADGNLLNQIVLTLVEAYLLYTAMRNFLSIRDLHRRLLAGVPIDHRENWRPGRRRAIAVNWVLTVLVLLNAAIPFLQLASQRRVTLTDQSAAGLPVLRLAEVEQNPALQRDPGPDRDGVDFSNNIETSWSPFARRTESRESGVIPGRGWADSPAQYSPSVQVIHYRLTIPQMAPFLLRDLMERYVYDPGDPPVRQWDTPLDEAYLTKKALFARLGDQVAMVRYYGEVPQEQVVLAANRLFAQSAAHT